MPQASLHFISFLLVTLSLILSLYCLHVEWRLREDEMEESRVMMLLHMRRQMRKFPTSNFSPDETSRNISAPLLSHPYYRSNDDHNSSATTPYHHLPDDHLFTPSSSSSFAAREEEPELAEVRRGAKSSKTGGRGTGAGVPSDHSSHKIRRETGWMRGGGKRQGKTSAPGVVKGGRERIVEKGGGKGGAGGGGFMYHPACDWTPRISCSSLLRSRYARFSQFIRIPFTSFHLPPIPNSAFAFLTYLLEFGCFFFTEGYYALTILVMIGTAGLGTLLAFVMSEVVCPLYVSLYVLNALSFWAARRRWIDWTMEEKRDDTAPEAGGGRAGSSPALSREKKEAQGKKGLSRPPPCYQQQQEEEEKEKVKRRKKNDVLVSSPEDVEKDDGQERNWEQKTARSEEYVRKRR